MICSFVDDAHTDSLLIQDDTGAPSKHACLRSQGVKTPGRRGGPSAEALQKHPRPAGQVSASRCGCQRRRGRVRGCAAGPRSAAACGEISPAHSPSAGSGGRGPHFPCWRGPWGSVRRSGPAGPRAAGLAPASGDPARRPRAAGRPRGRGLAAGWEVPPPPAARRPGATL